MNQAFIINKSYSFRIMMNHFSLVRFFLGCLVTSVNKDSFLRTWFWKLWVTKLTFIIGISLLTKDSAQSNLSFFISFKNSFQSDNLESESQFFHVKFYFSFSRRVCFQLQNLFLWCQSFVQEIKFVSLILWHAKKQAIISRSSSKVKYLALSTEPCELQWLLYLLKDLDVVYDKQPALYCDSQSVSILLQISCFMRERNTWRLTVILFDKMYERIFLSSCQFPLKSM